MEDQLPQRESKKEELRFKKFSRNLRFTREKTQQRAHFILKPWKRGGLEGFSRTKQNEMTAATFDDQVGNALQFFEEHRNEKTACARFIGALYFEARAESRMRVEANSDTD